MFYAHSRSFTYISPSDTEKKKQDAAGKAIADAMLGSARDDARYGKNSKANRKAQEKHALSFFNALLSSDRNGEAEDWVKRTSKKLNDEYLDVPYDIQKISPTSYKVIYTDGNAVPLMNMIYKYENIAPYEIHENINIQFYPDDAKPLR